MPRYEVEINGERYEVEAPDEEGVKIAIGQIQGESPASSGSDGPSGVDGAVRAAARGVLGVGSYLDELNAATNATLAPVVDPLLPDGYEKLPDENWGDRYDRALAIQRRKDAEYDQENPVASTALKIAGGVGSGGALLKAAPAVGSYVLGNTGASMPARIVAGAASGIGTGAVQGFGAGEGDASRRLSQAGTEAAVGGAVGGVMVPVAAGVNAAIKKGAQALVGQTDDALSSMGRAGQRYVTQELADPDKIALYRQRLEELGPDAVLADVSPDWQGVARGAATRPGTRSAIVDPLTQRAQAANARLASDLDANLGPAPRPSEIEAEIVGGLERVGDYYRPVMREARAVDTQSLAETLDAMAINTRGPEQKAIRQVRSYLNIPGESELDPNPQALLATRQAIDGMLSNEANPQVIRQLTLARQEVDGILADAAPGIKPIDAQYSELARQREALGRGRPVLNNEASAIRPQDLQDELLQGALPKGEMTGPSAVPTRVRQSARAEIDRAVGTKANDTTALRNIVRGEGDWNRQKLGILFGQENADRALSAIDREGVFADTANRVTRGSDTAMGNRFGQFLDEVSKGRDIPSDSTVAGALMRGAQAVARGVTRSNASANAGQVADDVGRLSVAMGSDRDAIIEALLRRGRENVVDQNRQRVVEALLQSGARSGYQSLPGVR